MTTDNTNNIIPVRADAADAPAKLSSASQADLLDAFVMSADVRPSSRKTYRRSLVQFFRFVNGSGRVFGDLTRADVIAFKESLLSGSRKRSELTVSLYMCAVRQFYAWTESCRLYPNIARGVKSPRRRQRTFRKMHLTGEQGGSLVGYFDGAEKRRLDTLAQERESGERHARSFSALERMSLRDEAIVTVMLYCGLRTIEVTRLDVGDIVFRAGRRALQVQGKGRDAKDAYVVLIDEAWKPLERYLRTRKGALTGEPLFPCEGYGHRGGRMSTRRLQAICKEGLRAIGLDGHEYSAHSLRHTTGVMIVENGGSLLDVKTVLRHESTNTSQIYIESAMEDLRMRNAPESRLEGCFKKAN